MSSCVHHQHYFNEEDLGWGGRGTEHLNVEFIYFCSGGFNEDVPSTQKTTRVCWWVAALLSFFFFCPVSDVVICEANEARGGGTGGCHEYTQQYFITKDGGRSPTQGTMNGLRSGGGQDHSDQRRRRSLVSASTWGQFFLFLSACLAQNLLRGDRETALLTVWNTSM